MTTRRPVTLPDIRRPVFRPTTAADPKATRNPTMCPACAGLVVNGQCVICTTAWSQAQLHRART